jgi:membrane-associated phospholipid phosphatase
MKPKIVALKICVAVALLSTISYAEGASPKYGTDPSPPQPVRQQSNVELRYNLPLDLTVTVSGFALSFTLELLAAKIAPTRCRWCDRDSDGRDSLNGFDASIRNTLRWSDTKTANTASNVFSYGLAPLSGIGIGALIAWHDDRMTEFPLDVLVVAEAAIIAVDVDEVSKLAFARQRPDIHARSPIDRAARRSDGDNLSFYSGHTTLSFALATAAGTVASMRRHRLAPLMWVAGMALATTSGYLRIAADRHYASDVITGAVVGSAIGFGIPYFGHRPGTSNIRVSALPTVGGTGLALSGLW